jgi:glycosyltransferase involved in cell wall biosynthesis
MRRFLFVTYHFPPSVGGGIPRIVSFTRDLPRYGWVPTVLTSTVHGAAAVDDAALITLPAQVEIVRAYCPLAKAGTRGHEHVVTGLKGAAHRALQYSMKLAMVPYPFAPWMPFAFADGQRALARQRHEAIVATYGPPANLLVGSALARASGLPLVLDYRDLWTDLPFAGHATPLHAAMLRGLERRIVRGADGVSSVSDGMTAYFRDDLGVPADRAITVHNGFDEHELSRIVDTRSADDRRFTLCYSGAVYSAYDVEPLARAIRKLADAGKITPETFRFLTLGNFPRDLIARTGIAHFHERQGFVSRAKMWERFGEVDAFLVIEMGEYGARMTYPVKIFDYLLTGKPVLGIVTPGGNCARLLAEMGMTELPANHEGAIANSILALLSLRSRKPSVVDPHLPPLSRFRRFENARLVAGLLDTVSSQNIDRIHSSSKTQRKMSV